MDEAFWAALAVMNLLAFALFGVDKRRAKLQKWRIRESTLILTAVFGGGIGALLGMRLFHHKTRKPLFRYGIPFLAAVWVIIILVRILPINI